MSDDQNSEPRKTLVDTMWKAGASEQVIADWFGLSKHFTRLCALAKT
jgi:hypothetical protein